MSLEHTLWVGLHQNKVLSWGTKAALINCKNASASSLSITNSAAKCYVIGIKNNRETYNAEFSSGSVSLSSYDYVLIIGGNGTKTYTFNWFYSERNCNSVKLAKPYPDVDESPENVVFPSEVIWNITAYV